MARTSRASRDMPHAPALEGRRPGPVEDAVEISPLQARKSGRGSPSAATPASTMATGCGARWALRAFITTPAGQALARSRWITWPVAWTPVSVRPAACRRTRLAAERGHGALYLRLNGGQVGLGLEAAKWAAVILHRQAIARHRLEPRSGRQGKAAQKISGVLRTSAFALQRAGCAPRRLCRQSTARCPGPPPARRRRPRDATTGPSRAPGHGPKAP